MAATRNVLRSDALAGPVFSNLPALIDYLTADLADAPAEQVRVLFLNAANRLIEESVVATGTVNEAPIYPREIMRRALEVNATALILVHNHPSGDPHPSKADIEATARVVLAGRNLGITVHDHLVIASSGWRSFRAMGLI